MNKANRYEMISRMITSTIVSTIRDASQAIHDHTGEITITDVNDILDGVLKEYERAISEIKAEENEPPLMP
jgi:hypothetical protein